MFRALWSEISNKLGTGFVVYYNEDVSDPRKLNAEGEQTIGVFRVSSGTIQPLKGDTGLQATVNIDFFAKVEDLAEVKKIDSAIEALALSRNGEIVVETITKKEGEEFVEEELFSYVCNFQVPRVLGNTVIGADSDRYVLKQLTFTVTLTSTLLFGDSGVCYLSEDAITEGNKAQAVIPGVLRWSPSTQLNAADNAEINQEQATVIPVNAGRKVGITGLATKDESFIDIMSNALTVPGKPYYFMFEFAGEAVSFRVVVERFMITGVKSDFVSYELVLAPLPGWV